MSYFPEPFAYTLDKVKVKLDLVNYETQSDFKKAAGVDTSKFAKKVNLASSKLDVDDLDTDRLITLLADLYKLSNVVVNDDATKVNTIDIVDLF